MTDRAVRHYGPLDKATIPGHFSAKLAGVSFAPGYPLIFHRLASQPDRRLVLVREPDNQYDANAVAVMVEGGKRVLGHLPAGLAARVAPEMDDGAEWSIVGWEVLVMPEHADRPGLSVELERA